MVGHTKSGKPIYDDRPAGHASYSNFTKEDHSDAAFAHGESAKHGSWAAGYGKGDSQKDWKKIRHFGSLSDSHHHQAMAAPSAAEAAHAKRQSTKSSMGTTPSGQAIHPGGKKGSTVLQHPISKNDGLRHAITPHDGKILSTANHVNADTARSKVTAMAKKHFPSYSSEDHAAASDAHMKHKSSIKKISGSGAEDGDLVADRHLSAAQFHSMASEYLKAGPSRR